MLKCLTRGGAAVDIDRVGGSAHLHTERLALVGVVGPQLHAAAPLCTHQKEKQHVVSYGHSRVCKGKRSQLHSTAPLRKAGQEAGRGVCSAAGAFLSSLSSRFKRWWAKYTSTRQLCHAAQPAKTKHGPASCGQHLRPSEAPWPTHILLTVYATIPQSLPPHRSPSADGQDIRNG